MKRDIKIGQKYKTRKYPLLGLPDLEEVKIVDITTLGDGTKIIKYKAGFLLPLYYEFEYNEFIKNTEI